MGLVNLGRPIYLVVVRSMSSTIGQWCCVSGSTVAPLGQTNRRPAHVDTVLGPTSGGGHEGARATSTWYATARVRSNSASLPFSQYVYVSPLL